MNYKKQGRLTGIAFISGTAAGVASIPFLAVMDKPGYMDAIAAAPDKLIIGALLIMVMGIACACIAYSIYPVLSRYHKGLAIGAVGLRTVEGALTLVSAATVMALAYVAMSAADGAQAAGLAVKSMHQSVSVMLGVAFCLGALLYNIGFYKTRLVPRWLSVWGIIALMLHIAERIMAAFGGDPFTTLSMVLNAPIAFQEMVMAVWLIILGYKKVEPAHC